MQSRNTLVMSHETAAALGLDTDSLVVADPDVVVFNRWYDVLVLVGNVFDLEAVFRCTDCLGTFTFVGLFDFHDIVRELATVGHIPLKSTLGYVETDDYGRFFRCYAFKAQWKDFK